MGEPGIPTADGRVLNPFNPRENPTFLPGDKVRDKRDASRRIWRIVARSAHLSSELMTLRDVEDSTNERQIMSEQLVPHLEMVAMGQRPGGAGDTPAPKINEN